MYVCMYVCMVCMYVCMCVCVYVCMYICTKQSMKGWRKSFFYETTVLSRGWIPTLTRGDRLLQVKEDCSTGTYHRVWNIKLSYCMGIQWLKRSYRVCTRSCFMLDQRVPFRSYDKRIGSPRHAVKLREFWESVLFVNVNTSARVLKRWPHYRPSGCHRLQPSLTLE